MAIGSPFGDVFGLDGPFGRPTAAGDATLNPGLPNGAVFVSDLAELVAAVDDAFAGSEPVTIAAYNGDYDLADGTLKTAMARVFTGKELTLTYAQTKHGPRFLNGPSSGSQPTTYALQMTPGVTIDGLHFHSTAAYCAARRGAGTGDGPITIGAGGSNSSDWVINDCLFTGELSDALRTTATLDTTGYDLPVAISLQYTQGSYTITNCHFENVYLINLALIGGALFEGNTFDGYYSDAIRIGSNSGTNGGRMIMRNNGLINCLGIYEEIAVGVPHADSLQFLEWTAFVAPAELLIERWVSAQGQTRGTKLQGTQSSSAGLSALILNQTAWVVDGVHGFSYGAASDVDLNILCIDSAFINQTVPGGSPAEFRHNNVNGDAFLLNSIFEGPINEIAAGTDPLRIENVGTVFSATFSDLAGPRDPATIAEVQSMLVGSSTLDGLGPFTTGGAYRTLKAVPDTPAQPTATGSASEFTSTRPAEPALNGATLDKWQMEYRVVGSNGAYTRVDSAGSTSTPTSLAAGTYEVRYRVVTTDGVPSLWSPVSADVVVTAATSYADSEITTDFSSALWLSQSGLSKTITASWLIDPASGYARFDTNTAGIATPDGTTAITAVYDVRLSGGETSGSARARLLNVTGGYDGSFGIVLPAGTAASGSALDNGVIDMGSGVWRVWCVMPVSDVTSGDRIVFDIPASAGGGFTRTNDFAQGAVFYADLTPTEIENLGAALAAP